MYVGFLGKEAFRQHHQGWCCCNRSRSEKQTSFSPTGYSFGTPTLRLSLGADGAVMGNQSIRSSVHEGYLPAPQLVIQTGQFSLI
jgi:hypothetical protein